MFFATASMSQEVISFGNNYSIIKLDDNTVGFYGEFEQNSSFKLLEALATTKAEYLDIESPGGLMTEAEIISNYLEKTNITVTIKEKSFCISACAFAILNAKVIKLDGEIKFHSPYIPYIPIDVTMYELLKKSDSFSLKLARLMVSAGYPISFAELLNDKTDRNTFIVFDSIENLYKFKNSGDGKLPEHSETLYTIEKKQ